MEHNPGTHINIEYDEHTHRFTRYFIAFKACIDGFNHCRPLLFLDATFLKGRYKGFLLATTAKDGNQASAHPQHWANAFFRGRRYGEMCSNATESFNSWVREARNLPIIRMADSIKTKLMRQMAKRRLAAQTWTGTICPKMESRFEKEFNERRSWKAS
ncbi:hypothetical protein ACSBR2_018100 [Camellia fascicularis]